MANFKDMYFNSIDKKDFDKIINEFITFLKKSKIKRIYHYTSPFTRFLKYLDENNLLFKDISQKYISEYLNILEENSKIRFKKVIVFLIKSGYLNKDNFNKYNTNNYKVDYYLDKYLVHLEIIGKRKTTIKRHKFNLTKFFNFCYLKNKYYLNDITRDLLEEYMFELYNTKNKKLNKNLSTASLIDYILSVKVYFRFLTKEEYITYNPCEFLKLPKVERKITNNYFSFEEIKKVFSLLKINTFEDYKIKVLFETMYNLGLRINEALHLRVQDINFETQTVYVKEAKGGYPRTVPMSNYIKNYLKIYLDYAYNNYLKNENGYIFYEPKNKKIMSVFHPNLVLKNIVKELKINKKISFHAFRKSIGKHLLEKGLGIRYVQRFLGHKCINATQSYTLLNIDDLKKALEKYHPREQQKELYKKQTKYNAGIKNVRV